MSHDYEGSDTEPMLRHDRRPSSDPRRSYSYPAEDPRYANEGPDEPRWPRWRWEQWHAEKADREAAWFAARLADFGLSPDDLDTGDDAA